MGVVRMLEAVGLDTPDWSQLLSTAMESGVSAVESGDYWEYVALYRGLSGVRIGVYKTEDGYLGETVGIDGVPGNHVLAVQVQPGIVMLDLLGEGGEVENRFFVEVDDPMVYPWQRGPDGLPGDEQVEFSDFHLAAVGDQLEVFTNFADLASQVGRKRDARFAQES